VQLYNSHYFYHWISGAARRAQAIICLRRHGRRDDRPSVLNCHGNGVWISQGSADEAQITELMVLWLKGNWIWNLVYPATSPVQVYSATSIRGRQLCKQKRMRVCSGMIEACGGREVIATSSSVDYCALRYIGLARNSSLLTSRKKINPLLRFGSCRFKYRS
jgi:hypothetical protein